MNIEATKDFLKQLRKLKKQSLNEQVGQVVQSIIGAESFSDVKNLKKLKGFNDYYRIRIGDYRIGIYFDGETVWLAAIAHRKDIYTYFP